MSLCCQSTYFNIISCITGEFTRGSFGECGGQGGQSYGKDGARGFSEPGECYYDWAK